MDDVNTIMGRLPDFIFARRRDIELEANLMLAGVLVTRIPKGIEVSGCDPRKIEQIIAQLWDAMKDQPDMNAAGIWHQGTRPADGLRPPFDARLLEDRCRRCVCLLVALGTELVINVPSDVMRQIMGGAVN